MLDYDKFLKSKQIAEKWGESQAKIHDVAYYRETLAQFYEYIQLLEREIFVTEEANIVKNQLSSRQTNNFSDEPTTSANDDEENPWFGF